jgi:cell division septum initiation protein DivIVA
MRVAEAHGETATRISHLLRTKDRGAKHENHACYPFILHNRVPLGRLILFRRRCTIAILQLVDQLIDMVRNSPSIPLTPYRLIRGRELEQMIERMRINVPSSIRESERMLAERDRILADAQAEAQRIVKEARQQAIHLVSERAVVAQAQHTAERIEREARAAAQRRSGEADQYAVQVLAALADHLRETLSQVENGIQVMQPAEESAQVEDETAAVAAQAPASDVPS